MNSMVTKADSKEPSNKQKGINGKLRIEPVKEGAGELN